MPIYAYQCQACGHELEALQRMSDAPLTHCPNCNTDNLTKQVTAAAFRLGGGGWYETDFKSGDKKNIASKDSTDSKPEKTSKADKPAPSNSTVSTSTSSTSE